MKLSIYIATRNGSSRNPPGTFADLLQRFKELADELVVLVDDTSTDDTSVVAKKFTKNVFSFVHDPLFIEMQRQAFYRCSGDWIFAADDDDKLSSRWTRPLLEKLMSLRSVTHYWVPSRYLVSDDLYLSTSPYIGHFSAQFYRNIESIAVLPKYLHQQTAFAGEPAYLAGLYTDAMNFAWHDREAREAKLRSYDEAYDEADTGFDQTRFYRYEDYYFETRPIGSSMMPAVMEPVKDEGVARGVHVRILDPPQSMTIGQAYWVTARIVNNSHRALLPQSEFVRWGTLALGYHWSPESDKEEANLRTPFPARILPNHQHDALVKIKAPDVPGSYRLQIDILEEDRTWFSKLADGGAYEASSVEVKPLVWPPRVGSRPGAHG
jgi:glycosyltransferase involved in cell wall biosynthesis